MDQLQIKSMKILVVDDNEAAALALKKLLGLRGHITEAVFSGTDALKKTLEYEPEVIMLDIGLPDMTGYDVAQELRTEQNFPGILIALTGYGQENDKQHAEEVGFDYHLTKPAGLKEIEAILTEL